MQEARPAPPASILPRFFDSITSTRTDMKRESPTDDGGPPVLLLVLAIATVLGCFAGAAGCTASSTTTPAADSGIGTASTMSPAGPPQDRVLPNGTPPSGAFPGDAAPNGTPPAGAPPGDRNFNGTAPAGAPPDRMRPNGTQ